MDVNEWLDRVPRTTVDVGHRRLPAFRSLGVIGFQLALATCVLVALLNGLPVATALGLSAVAGLSFFAWGLARRAVTGRETLVLMEYVWAALAAVGGFLWATGGPVVAGVDAMAVALCPFLLFGRLGCATVGCCHGLPAAIGLRYGPEHHVRPRFVGRRLFPVQLLEAAGLGAIAPIGLVLVATGPPGRATVWFLVAYAILRFGCEALRGDERPTVLGLPVPRAMCVVQAVAGVVAAEAWLVPGPLGRALWVATAALGAALACGAALTVLRAREPLTDSAIADEVWELIDHLAARAGPEPTAGSTASGITVVVTADVDRLHVSLSHPDHSPLPVGVALAPDHLVERGGIVHLAWASAEPTAPSSPDTPRSPVPDEHGTTPDDDYFGRAGADGAVARVGVDGDAVVTGGW